MTPKNDSVNEQLALIANAFSVDANNQLQFCGRPLSMSNSGLYNQDAQQALLQNITSTLYQYAYCQRFSGAFNEPSITTEENVDLTTILSNANQSRSRWDQHWTVDKMLPEGKILVVRGREQRQLNPGEFVQQDPYHGDIQVGSLVQIFCPHESTKLQTGVYFAFSTQSPALTGDHRPVLRFYWNISEQGVAALVEQITQVLNRFQIPFRFKCMCYSQYFYRQDVAVLYIPITYYQITVALLFEIYQIIRAEIRPDVCLFTKPLLPGFFLAEDPGHNQSFGMHRCGVLAQGIYNAWAKNKNNSTERLDEVYEVFNAQGINLKQPYLNPGAVDCYDLAAIENPEVA